MNVYPITFQTVLNAFRHQWKRILVTVLLFALLGGAAGFLFRDRGAAEAGGNALPLPAVDYSQLPDTESYYSDCLAALTGSLDALERYLTTISTNTAPEGGREAVLDGELQAALDALSTEAKTFRSSRVTPLQSEMNSKGTVIVPAEYLDGLAERYAMELETVRMDLISAQAAAETVRQMDSPNYDATFTGTYTTFLSRALSYGDLLRSQAIYEKSLDRLQNDMPELRAESRRVGRELDAAADEWNALLDRFASVANEAAKEADLIFTPTVANRQTDIIVTHAHRASSGGEALAVMVVFFALTGLCTGVFLAVFREARASRKAGEPGGEEAGEPLES